MCLQKERNWFQPAGSWGNKSEVYTDTNKNNGIFELLRNWPAKQEELLFLSLEILFTLLSMEGAMMLMTSIFLKSSTSEEGRTLMLHDILITSYHTFIVQPANFAKSKFLNVARKQQSAWQTEFQRSFSRKAFLLKDHEQIFYIFEQK